MTRTKGARLRGRLNIFQTGMLRWRELHPYNAVHVVRVDAPLAASRLEQAIDAHLARRGLTGLVLDAARGRYEYLGGPANTQVRVVGAGADPRAVVTAEIERELNQPFARDGAIDPFRFFAVDAGASFHLGIAYDHFIAGGDSIVLLLKDLTDAYLGKSSGRPPPVLERYPGTFRHLLLRHPWHVLRAMRHLKSSIASGRRAFRPPYPGGDDMHTAFDALWLAAADAVAFRTAARGWSVTPNDLMIAILMRALSPLAIKRLEAKRRHEIGIASIVNLRSDFDAPAATTFGQFLSSFHVTHAVPDGITLRELAIAVHAQTAAIRSERRYYQTLIGISAINQILRFLPRERRLRFHVKSLPLWAGTTPVNVDEVWQGAGGPPVAPEYLRGVPTGPLIPLVVAVTTSAGALQLGLTYRPAVFGAEAIAQVVAGIRQAFAELRRAAGEPPHQGLGESSAATPQPAGAKARDRAAVAAARMGFAK